MRRRRRTTREIEEAAGGVVPGVVPSRLPVSPAYEQMERAVREDSPVHAPPPERPREPVRPPIEPEE